MRIVVFYAIYRQLTLEASPSCLWHKTLGLMLYLLHMWVGGLYNIIWDRGMYVVWWLISNWMIDLQYNVVLYTNIFGGTLVDLLQHIQEHSSCALRSSLIFTLVTVNLQ